MSALITHIAIRKALLSIFIRKSPLTFLGDKQLWTAWSGISETPKTLAQEI